MVLDVVLYGDPILRKKAVPVTDFDDNLRDLCQNMIETMKDRNGVGIAAPQVGVGLRIFIVDPTPQEEAPNFKEPLIVINPKLTVVSPDVTEVEQEGCLSIPGLQAHVKRYSEIILEAVDLQGVPFQIQETGFVARIFQHENDHLDGILFTDKVLATDKKFVEQFLKNFRHAHA